jgi:hypothetical protein
VAEADGSAIGVLAAVALTIALAWIVTRTSLGRGERPRPDPVAPGAAVVVTLALCALTLTAWAINPYTGLVLILPLHAWMLAVLSGVPARTRAWMALAGLLPAALIVFTYAQHFRLGPLDGAWYLFLLVTGHHVGLASALLGCVALGLLASVIGIVVAHARRSEPRAPHVPRGGRRRSGPDERPISGPAGPPLERIRR